MIPSHHFDATIGLLIPFKVEIYGRLTLYLMTLGVSYVGNENLQPKEHTMYYREIISAVSFAEADVQQLRETVKSILAKVKNEGDGAVRYFEKEFDSYDPPSFRISPEQAARAVELLPAEVVEELDFTIEQVTNFREFCLRFKM